MKMKRMRTRTKVCGTMASLLTSLKTTTITTKCKRDRILTSRLDPILIPEGKRSKKG